MLTTREEARETILHYWDEIHSAPFAVDEIESLVDSELPIYYNEIISEWTELGSDDSNQFGEIMTPNTETTIYDLMSADLYIYYKNLFMSVFNEILDEQEQAGE